MDDGIITEWKVASGDRVRQGQILFDIETNKSVMEVESPASGVIRDLAPITGEPVAVGTVVGWIDADAEAGASLAAAAERTRTTSPSAATAGIDHATSSAKRAASVEGASVAPSDSIRATPLARRAARMLDVNLADVAGSGPAGRIVEKDVAAHAHEDHVAALGWCIAGGFRGRLLMTAETRREVDLFLEAYADASHRRAARFR